MQFYLPEQLYTDICSVQWFCILTIGLFGILSISFALKNNPKGVFTAYALFIIIISAFGTKMFYEIDYKFGQNDLMEFAKSAKENNNKIAVLNQGRKYSVLYYYGDKVYYISTDDEENFDNNKKILKNKNTVTIIRNKQIPELNVKIKFDIIKEGRKFSLVKVH